MLVSKSHYFVNKLVRINSSWFQQKPHFSVSDSPQRAPGMPDLQPEPHSLSPFSPDMSDQSQVDPSPVDTVEELFRVAQQLGMTYDITTLSTLQDQSQLLRK